MVGTGELDGKSQPASTSNRGTSSGGKTMQSKNGVAAASIRSEASFSMGPVAARAVEESTGVSISENVISERKRSQREAPAPKKLPTIGPPIEKVPVFKYPAVKQVPALKVGPKPILPPVPPVPPVAFKKEPKQVAKLKLIAKGKSEGSKYAKRPGVPMKEEDMSHSSGSRAILSQSVNTTASISTKNTPFMFVNPSDMPRSSLSLRNFRLDKSRKAAIESIKERRRRNRAALLKATAASVLSVILIVVVMVTLALAFSMEHQPPGNSTMSTTSRVTTRRL